MKPDTEARKSARRAAGLLYERERGESEGSIRDEDIGTKIVHELRLSSDSNLNHPVSVK
jgi:hypothetical protein